MDLRKFEASERQHGACFVCLVPLVDQRVCDGPCGPQAHPDVKTAMPRFNLHSSSAQSPGHHFGKGDCDRWHWGNPHTSTLFSEVGLVAAHTSCSAAYVSMVRNNHQSHESAIARLRARRGISATAAWRIEAMRAGQRATEGLRSEPVDNGQTAQSESATRAPSTAQPGSCTTPPTHSTTTTTACRTQVGTQLAREDEEAIRLDERHRLARLLDQHADTIADFAHDKRATIDLVALMVELGIGR